MMNNHINWGSRNDLDCVVLCGGKGLRMAPHTSTTPKTLLPTGGKPLLWHAVDYFRQYCARFIFVTGYLTDDVENFVKTLDVPHEIIVDEKGEGPAKALLKARDMVKDHFIVINGECLFSGRFFFPAGMVNGIGVAYTSNPLAIQQSCAVHYDTDIVEHVEEAPDRVTNGECGMGAYFFSREIFDYIDGTPPEPKTGEVELSGVINAMVKNGVTFHRVMYIGDYVKVTYPEDLLTAGRIVAKALREKEEQASETITDASEYLAGLSGIRRVPRLLVVRSLPFPIFRRIVRFIRGAMPVDKLYVLCQPGAVETVKNIPGVDEVVLFPKDGMFRLDTDAAPLIKKLRSMNFDAIVVPYNNPDRAGYFHVETLAKLSAKVTYGISPPTHLYELSWWNVFRRGPFLLNRFVERAVFHAINGAFALRRTVRAFHGEGA